MASRFENFSEMDVREEIIAPLINRLGYKSGTQNNVIREQSLRYPRRFLGRKDPKKDPELRGKADYILEVSDRLRWVIEAKAPAACIATEDIEQAWSYAAHPEVRAIYFVLCNAHHWVVYRTTDGPSAEPVLALTYERFDKDFQLIQNLLGPEALQRDFPDNKLDVGQPIAGGLRSTARITNGWIRYEKNTWNLQILNEIQTTIRDGALERDETGKLVVWVRAGGPTQSLQELNERLGLATFEMVSEESQLSTDRQKPTVFVYENRVILPAGEKVLNLATWRQEEFPNNITCQISAKAVGSYSDHAFSGTFLTYMRYLEMNVSLELYGSFHVHLA